MTERALDVLVVEEDREFRELLRDALSDLGYRVAEGALGVSVRELAPRYDVVVAEPGSLGLFEFTSRPDPEPWYARVVLMAAFAEPSLRDLGRHLGVAAVLAKPFALSELAAAVMRVPPRA